MDNSEVVSAQEARDNEPAMVKVHSKKDKVIRRVYMTLIKVYFLLMSGVLGLGIKSPFANVGLFFKQAQVLALALSYSSSGELQVRNKKPNKIYYI